MLQGLVLQNLWGAWADASGRGGRGEGRFGGLSVYRKVQGPGSLTTVTKHQTLQLQPLVRQENPKP